MKNLLEDEAYSFVCSKDKEFIVAFDAEMNRLGYTCNQTIGDGYCWGAENDYIHEIRCEKQKIICPDLSAGE